MMISGRIDDFAEYSQFKSLKEFNNTIEMFLLDHKKDFSKGELVALKRLVRFSAKRFGVANAKIGTLLKAINEKANGYGISRSTFERMLRKAIELGILTIKNTLRRKGGKGHNVYVFNTIDVLKKEKLTYREETAKPCESKGEQGKFEGETISLLETNNIKDINKRIGNDFSQNKLDHSFTSDYVPKDFVKTVKPFFDDAKTIEEYWRMVKIDTYKIQRYLDEETVVATAMHSFKQMISKLKNGMVKNPIAYFKGVVKQQFDKVYNELPLDVFN